MKILKIAGNTVKIYSDIEEMPSDRFQEFNRLMMIDVGIGADASSVSQHINMIIHGISKGDLKRVENELKNYRQNIAFIMDKTSPQTLAFCALIKEFNGKPFSGIDDESIKQVHDRLMKEKKGILDCIIKDQKKNIEDQIKTFFPEKINDHKIIEYYNIKRKKIKATLDGLKNGDFALADKYSDELIDFSKSIDFTGAKGYEIRSKKNYEDLKLIITREFGIDTKAMTVIQFYQSIDLINKEAQKKNKNTKAFKNGKSNKGK